MTFRHEDTPKQETLDDICDLLDEQPEADTKRILGKLTFGDLLWLEKALIKQAQAWKSEGKKDDEVQ